MGELNNPKIGRPKKVSNNRTLSDLGITRNMSSRVQTIAAIPAQKLDEIIDAHLKADRELTSNALLKIGRHYRCQQRRQVAKQTAIETGQAGGSIHIGDMSLLNELAELVGMNRETARFLALRLVEMGRLSIVVPNTVNGQSNGQPNVWQWHGSRIRRRRWLICGSA